MKKFSILRRFALGSGATIAAIISFVGASHTVLHDLTLLRCSLVVLALALFSAMFRNWLYPFYTIAVWTRHKAQADWQVDDAEAEMFADYPQVIPVDTDGSPIHPTKYRREYEERKLKRETSLGKAQRHEDLLFRVVLISETLALACVAVAAVLLVILIWVNVGVPSR